MERKTIITVIVFLILFFGFIYLKSLKQKELKNYLSEYDFAIGKVENIFKRGNIGTNIGVSSITYSYNITNKRYTKSYNSKFYKILTRTNKNELYLVIYNKSNPQNSILLSDYHILDTTDFQKCIERFKKTQTEF